MANFAHFLELRPSAYLCSLSAVCDFSWTQKLVAWGCDMQPVASLFAEFDVATTLVISTSQSAGLAHGVSSLASHEHRLYGLTDRFVRFIAKPQIQLCH
jgi:hypothetical protein